MTSSRSRKGLFGWRLAALGVLVSGALLASPARALMVYFEGPGGIGISGEAASDVFEAGFAHLEPEGLAAPAGLGITIPAPNVTLYDPSSAHTHADPTRARSTWTVDNGDQALVNAWLVFLMPMTAPPFNPSFDGYDAPNVGIDMQLASWGVVEINIGSGEGMEQYFYPAVHLGDVTAGGSVQFQMNHVIAQTVDQLGNQVQLPKYAVGILTGFVPEPGALSLFAVVLMGFALRRARG